MTTRIPRLIVPTALALFVAAACGDTKPASDTRGARGGKGGGGGAAARAGTSGKAGSGGASGSAVESGDGGEGGDETGSVSAGRGGSGGRPAAGGAGGRAQSSGGRPSSTGGTAGAAGDGGEAGALMCVNATAKDWFDVSETNLIGIVGSYATDLVSGELPSDAFIILDVWQPDTGPFELGRGDDDNFQTCNRCLVAAVPVPGADNRVFFANEGTIDIAASSDPQNGLIDATLTNVRLIEVTLDPSTAESTPVEGGGCIQIASSHVAVDPNAPPNGAGGAAGAGGAGGEGGGSGAAGAAGAAGAPNIPTDCFEIGVGAPWVFDPGYTIYKTITTPNLGSPNEDGMGLMFWETNEIGTFQLGKDLDATWATCEHCFIVLVPDGTSSGRQFLAVAGTLEIGAGSSPLYGILDATLTDVTFVELEDDLVDPVEGGACLHLETATISLD